MVHMGKIHSGPQGIHRGTGHPIIIINVCWASVLWTFPKLTHLISTTALWHGFYYHMHFTKKETEAQRSNHRQSDSRNCIPNFPHPPQGCLSCSDGCHEALPLDREARESFQMFWKFVSPMRTLLSSIVRLRVQRIKVFIYFKIHEWH